MSISISGGRRASLSFSLKGCFLPAVAGALLIFSTDASATPPLAGYNPADLPYGKEGPFIEAVAFAADTVLPVESILDDSWNGAFTPQSRNRADLYWKGAAGVVANGWRVAAFHRGEVFVESNRDAVEFFYAKKKKRDLEINRTYSADMKANGFIANGVEVSCGRRLDKVSRGLAAGVTLRVMDPTYLQDGRLTGSIIPLTARSYDYDLFLDYAYSRNIIYHREDEHLGDGYGYSADVGASYRRGGWSAEALVRDLAGTIRWNSAPYTTAYAVTPAVSTSTGGYQDFTPSIRGYEGNKRFVQRIPLKTDLTVGWEEGAWSASTTVVLIRDEPFTWVEAGYAVNDRVRVSLGYNIDYKAVSYELEAYGFNAGVMMDGLEVGEANAVGARIGYRYVW